MMNLIAILLLMTPCQEKGLEWRKTDKLVINNLVIFTDMSAPPQAGRKRTVRIDGFVPAKRHIGPMAAGGK
jgi:hypothetical protein